VAPGKAKTEPRSPSGGKLRGRRSQRSTFNRPRSVPAITAEQDKNTSHSKFFDTRDSLWMGLEPARPLVTAANDNRGSLT
jgi:hypothetical protein